MKLEPAIAKMLWCEAPNDTVHTWKNPGKVDARVPLHAVERDGSVTHFTLAIPPNETVELPAHFDGAIDGRYRGHDSGGLAPSLVRVTPPEPPSHRKPTQSYAASSRRLED